MKRRLVYSLPFFMALASLVFTVNTFAAGMMSMMPMPTSQMMFTSGPVTDPILGSTPQGTMPMGVGSVAMGGDMLTIHAELGQFPASMDMYFAVYAPGIDPFNVYIMNPQGGLQPVSMGTMPWMTGVTSIDQMPFGSIPTSMLPKGTYYMGLMATPSGGNVSTYYFWMTNFVIQ